MTTAFGYTVIWVPDVERTVRFYEEAFGLERKSVTSFGPTVWAEMATGSTTLAFASENEAEELFHDGYYANRPDYKPALILISLLTEDVAGLYERALKAGATKRDEPKRQPWGQTVARVRDLNGVLVSLATPIAGQP